MSVEFYRGSPGKFDSRTLSRETLSRWTGRNSLYVYVVLVFDCCCSCWSGCNTLLAAPGI